MKKHHKYATLFGLAIGYSISVYFFPGGCDAFYYFLRSPFPGTTTPAWVYLITYPISFFGWPLSWSVLTFISVIVVGTTAIFWNNKNWWIAILGNPFVWNIWYGQIEFIPSLGLLITGLYYQNQISTAWLGISWIALITKPFVGFGILLFQLFIFIDQRKSLKQLIPPLLVFVTLIVLTSIIWPDWISDGVKTLKTFRPQTSWWNASIWPYGLVSMPIAIYFSRKQEEKKSLRLLSSASLLSSPYFALYHCTTLLTVTESIPIFMLSWAILLIGKGAPTVWMKWGWIVPLSILLLDIISIISSREKEIASSN